MRLHRTNCPAMPRAAMTCTCVRAAVVALTIMSVAACGSDDTASTSDQATGDLAAFCAVADEIAGDEGFPSATLATSYASLAPDEVRDAVERVAAPYVEHEGDDVALFVALADDDVEGAFRVVNAFESEECDIDNRAVNREDVAVDEAADRVDVRATEYAFEMPASVAAGPTSLVLANDGEEAHFMLIFRIEPGHTVQDALAFEGDPQEAGLVTDLGLESGFAAPGGDDIEVINADLEAGDYALVCFLPGPDGTPHALTGMAAPFTVT